MARYIKKPVVIEAVQWTDTKESGNAIVDLIGESKTWSIDYSAKPPTIKIPTLEGTMTASIGDWIIKGINGEFYPCKPEIFEKTYEPAE